MNASDGGSAIKQLPEGLYELLNTEGLTTSLSRVPELEPHFGLIDDEDTPDILSRHVAGAVREALAGYLRSFRMTTSLLLSLLSFSPSTAGKL